MAQGSQAYAKALAKALQKPRTLHDFFGKGAAGGSTSAPPKPLAAAAPAGAKRPAAAPTGPPPKKKPLQASPFANAAAAAPARRCPICSQVLRGTNAEENAHVDECMTRRQSLEVEPCIVID